MVGARHVEVTLRPARIEGSGRGEVLHLGQQSFKLIEDPAASQSELKAMRRPDKKVILKQCACALQSSAYSGLAQQ